MYMYRIGNVARDLYEKLSSDLSGPLAKYLPTPWVDEALEAEKIRFRNRIFSPLGRALGLGRAGARP